MLADTVANRTEIRFPPKHGEQIAQALFESGNARDAYERLKLLENQVRTYWQKPRLCFSSLPHLILGAWRHSQKTLRTLMKKLSSPCSAFLKKPSYFCGCIRFLFQHLNACTNLQNIYFLPPVSERPLFI